MQSERPRLKASVKVKASVGESSLDDATGSSISIVPSTTTPPLKCPSSLSFTPERGSEEAGKDGIDSNFRETALVEKELKQVKGIMGELASRGHELNKQENELERKEQGLERKEQKLERTGVELDRRCHELKKKENELLRDEQEFERRGHKLIKRENDLERWEQGLDRKEQELERKEQELERKEQELERREQGLDSKKQELERTVIELERRGHELIKRENELERKEQAMERKEQEAIVGVNEDMLVEFEKKITSILNKLTGRNLSSMLEKFQSLEITSEKQLSLCVKLVFEKAVGEPGQAENCAKICKAIQFRKAQKAGEGECFVHFRKLIISMCQKEFEQRNKNWMDSSSDYCQKKEKLMNRSFGVIQFIGELYMEHMLTARIMHECIQNLILAADEDSLMCLCKLFHVVLENLVSETQDRLAKGPQTGVNNMSVYFQQMSKMAEQAKFSPSLRMMMQDVVRSC